jgi:hypothetical protein
MPRQPHDKLSFLHVLADCSFSYLALRHFLADPRPDPMCCVPLLTGRFLITLKNLIDKRNRRLQLPVRPTHPFSRLRQRAGNRIPDHSTMYLQLSGHAGDRAHSKLILPTDLFEYLHLGSPIQRTSPSGLTPELEYPLVATVGQNKPPKWANSEYRNQRVTAAFTGRTPEGEPINGDYTFVDEFPMAEGFEENVEFFELTYLDAEAVELDIAFSGIAPLLWLRAGGRGPIIGESLDAAGRRKPYLWTESYGVLFNSDRWRTFVGNRRESASTAFIVTDSQTTFAGIASELPETPGIVRLYENYLTTFAINWSYL